MKTRKSSFFMRFSAAAVTGFAQNIISSPPLHSRRLSLYETFYKQCAVRYAANKGK